MKSEPRTRHVVTVEQQEVAFDRVQDAVALIKLLSRAKVRRAPGDAAPPAVSACLRPAIGYAQPARVRYEAEPEATQ